MKRILLIMVALALTACGTTVETRVVEVRPEVPESLLACRSQPEPPAAGTQRDVARWILDLAEAGADCRSKLGSVGGILAQ